MTPVISFVMIALKLSQVGHASWTTIGIVFIIEILLVIGVRTSTSRWGWP